MLGYLFMLVAAGLFLAAVALLIKRVKAAGAGDLPAAIRAEESSAMPEEVPEEDHGGGKVRESPRIPPVSLVLLQRQGPEITRETLAPMIKRITGLTITDEEGSDASWAMPPMPALFPMVIRHNLYALTVVQEPYAADRDWYVDDDTAPELLSAWQKHRAWMSLDLVASKPGGGGDDPMGFIGRMAAELAGDQTLAIVYPAVRHAVAFDQEVRTMLRKRPAKEVVKGPLRAFALLRQTPRKLTQPELTTAALRAWGKKLSENPRDASCALVAENGGGGLAFLQHDGVRLGIAMAPGRYVRDVKQAAAEIDDLRLRQAFEAHTNWWGIDFVEAAVNVSKARVYQMLGRLAAEFLDEGVTMLFAPEYRRAAIIDGKIRQQLRGQDPLEAVFHATKPPLLQVQGDEPAMQKAIAEARRRWPEFVVAFVARKAGHHFAIKRGFPSGKEKDHQEFMWVQVTDIQRDQIVGVLDNDPVYVKGVRAGDRVVSRPAEVIDWIYKGDEDLVGNFTGPVILAAQRRRD